MIQYAIYVLRKRIKIEDLVYTHTSILDEYNSREIENMISILKQTVKYAQNDNWLTLFGRF